MTREEAIKLLTQYIDYDAETPDYYKMEEACKVAIKALSAEPCEDCISRDAVQNYVESHIQEINTGYGDLNNHTNRILRMIVDGIRNLPSIQPKPKTGHWIIKEGREQGYDIAGIKTWYIQIMCDKCGFIKTAIEGHTGQYHFCPNCGCRMVEPQESKENKNIN